MYSDFGENLRMLRKSSHLTQKQLGKKCGISAAAISKYESGAVKPSLEVAVDIAHYLNVSLDRLFSIQTKNLLSLEGLTPEQIKITTHLKELFRRQNTILFSSSASTLEQYEILGKIVAEFFKGK